MVKKDTLHPKNSPTDDIYPTTSLDQIIDLKGVGEGSIQQPNYGVTGSDGVNPTTPSEATGKSSVALNVRNKSKGDATVTGGYNSTANTKGDIAFGVSAQAGLTEEEFNTKYPSGYWYDNDKMYLNYEQFKKRITNGAIAISGGRAKGKNSFSGGSHINGTDKFPLGTGAIGDYSVAFGLQNVTYGERSGSGGKYNSSSGENSLTWGEGLTAPNANQTIVGQYNKNWHDDEGVDPYKTLYEVGNGTSTENRSNAMVVTDDGRVKGFGKPKDKNDFIRIQELYERIPNPPNYSISDIGTYVLKAIVDDDFNIVIKWVKE